MLTRLIHPALLSLLYVIVQQQPAAAAEQPGGAGAIGSLVELRWRHRIVLVLESADVDRDVATLRAHASDLDERDTVWFLLRGDAISTNFPGKLDRDFALHLRSRFGSGPPVVLIGKDGGVKLQAEYLDPQAIFSHIDAMPMRRREMRQRP